MTQEEKSRVYSALLSEYDRLSNQINSIKGESLEINEEQNKRIQKIQIRINQVINEMKKMMF